MILGTTGFSTGELTLTFDWLSRLTRPLEVHLALSRRVPHLKVDRPAETHYLPATSGVPLAQATRAVFETVRPDALVVADIWLLMVASPELGAFYQGRPVLAPWLLEVSRHTPVLALDLYDWDRHAPEIDLFGRRCGPLAAPVPASIGRLMPSPYLPPARSAPGRGRFMMMTRRPPPAARERRDQREALGLGPRAVLIPSSPWHHGLKLLPDAGRTAEALPALTYSLLDLAAASAGPIDVVQLGPQPIPLPAGARHLRLHHVSQLEPHRFVPLLASVDLVLSTNAIASTNVRAASLGVPVASLYVGPDPPPARIPGGAPWSALASYLESARPSYPLAIGAMGMEHLVRLLLENNPFAGVQRRFDVTEPERAVEGLREVLFEPAARDSLRHAQESYFSLLERELDAPDVALDRALSGPSGAVRKD